MEYIDLFEKADKIIEVPNIKKLKGHATAFRYRKGKIQDWILSRTGYYPISSLRHPGQNLPTVSLTITQTWQANSGS